MLEQRNYSLVGTEEYVPPEILQRKDVSYATDLWSLGIILYQFFYGRTPFKGATEYISFENIVKKEVQFPENPQATPELKDLIKRLLEKDAYKRIGFNSISEIKQHPFFKGINFSILRQQEVPYHKQTVLGKVESRSRPEISPPKIQRRLKSTNDFQKIGDDNTEGEYSDISNDM